MAADPQFRLLAGQYWQYVLDQPGQVLANQIVDGAPYQNQRLGGILVVAPGCRVTNCTVTNTSGIGIGVTGDAKGIQITGNSVSGSWMQGISFIDRDKDYSGSCVACNKVTGALLDAIQIGTGVTVLGNEVADCQFAGIYALTGTQNAHIIANSISDCYGGIDVSWGVLGGNRAGTNLTHGVVIERNRVARCMGGIGTASNGTLIHGNIVTDCGTDPRQTWTAGTATIATPGTGYRVGDVLCLPLDNSAVPQPAKYLVREVDANGGVIRVDVYYLGVYYTPPPNPVSPTGGTGTGVTLNVSRWNQRGAEPIGMALTDACDCVVTGNISGNITPDAAAQTQKVGFLVKRIFSAPVRNLIQNNNFSRNTLAAVTGYYANHYTAATLTGNVIGQNTL